MSKIRLLVAIMGVMACAGALAQESPVSHVVNFPRGAAAWEVAFEKPSKPPEGDNSPPAAEKIEIVRRDNLRRDTVHWTDGTVREQWWCENPPVLVFESPNGSVSAMKGAYAAERRYDESSFTWVNAKAFMGMEVVRGKKCSYYEKEFSDAGEASIKLKWRAWIDPETQRPVAYNNGFSTVFFTFSEAIPEKLEVPGKFEKKLRRYQAFYAPAQKTTR